MAFSLRINPSWFAKVVNTKERMAQMITRGIEATGRMGSIIAQAGSDLRADQQSDWERRQAAQDRMTRNFSDHIRGVERFNDPFSGREVELPAGYVLRQDCLLAAQSNVLGGQAALAIKDLGSRGQRIADGQTASVTLEGGIDEALDSIKKEMDAKNPDSLMHYLKYELNPDNADSVMASLVATGEHLRQTARKLDEQLTMDPNRTTLMVKVHQVLDRLENITKFPYKLEVPLKG